MKERTYVQKIKSINWCPCCFDRLPTFTVMQNYQFKICTARFFSIFCSRFFGPSIFAGRNEARKIEQITLVLHLSQSGTRTVLKFAHSSVLTVNMRLYNKHVKIHWQEFCCLDANGWMLEFCFAMQIGRPLSGVVGALRWFHLVLNHLVWIYCKHWNGNLSWRMVVTGIFERQLCNSFGEW